MESVQSLLSGWARMLNSLAGLGINGAGRWRNGGTPRRHGIRCDSKESVQRSRNHNRVVVHPRKRGKGAR